MDWCKLHWLSHVNVKNSWSISLPFLERALPALPLYHNTHSIFCAYCRYGAAEADCTQALSLDSSYTKAYLRRGAARFQMGRVQQADADYKEALKLEPSNKQAQAELKSIQKVSSYLAPKVHKQLKHYGAVTPCKRQSSRL